MPEPDDPVNQADRGTGADVGRDVRTDGNIQSPSRWTDTSTLAGREKAGHDAAAIELHGPGLPITDMGFTINPQYMIYRGT